MTYPDYCKRLAALTANYHRGNLTCPEFDYERHNLYVDYHWNGDRQAYQAHMVANLPVTGK